VALVALEAVVDLVRGLAEQEQPTAEQDQVAPGELLAEDRDERRAVSPMTQERRAAAGRA
jgi:hypothetical protein